MSSHPTTIRVTTEATLEDKSLSDAPSATVRILDFWRNQSNARIQRTIEAFPSLAANKSLLLDLILKEFKLQRQEFPVPIDDFCDQFRHLDSSMEQSIVRALEVQEFLDDHPELLEHVVDFQWPSPGDFLQSFQVVEELGRGALARVYLCRESGLGHRDVVVKVARGSGYEAEILGRLEHPNIVPIYSVANDAEHFVSFICMPYRGRSTLQDVVDHVRKQGIPRHASNIIRAARFWELSHNSGKRTNTLDRKDRLDRLNYVDGILRIAVQLAGALAHAHDVGVYHGDLKPSNVLLTQDGKPLLIDFNLSTDLRSGTGPRGGTLAYMPPELLVEMSGDAPESSPKYDARSEVYSFGAVVYQLLTGDVPFHADFGGADPVKATRELLANQRAQRPCIRLKNPCVNAALERIVLECLSVNSADRPPSMVELQQRLQVQSRPLARLRRLARARPGLTAILSCAAFLTLICCALYLLLRSPYDARQFAKGQTLKLTGDYRAAIDSFNLALATNPLHQDAMYERARTELLSGDALAALNDFSRASELFADPQSAAYTGYCLNLMGKMSEAIPWYELALKRGVDSPGLHNNLGVSYARGRSQLGRLEQLSEAQYHLEKALELDQKSLVVRGNLVMLALIRSAQDQTFDQNTAVVQLEALLQAVPHSPRVLSDAAQLYSSLSLNDSNYVKRAMSALESSILAGSGPKVDELSMSPRFAVLRRDARFADLSAKATTSNPASPPEILAMFIDPITGVAASVAPR